MDASPLFDPQYLPVIAATLFGFLALAAALLVPIWRFLNREEEVAQDWTPEAVAERLRERREARTNGAEDPGDTESSSEQGSAASRPPTT